MKKIFSVLSAIIVFIQMMPEIPLNTSAESSNPTTQIFTVNPSEMTMTEGETCNLTVTVDPEFSDTASVYLYSSKHKTIVSSDYQVTAYHCGEENISIHVSVPDDSSDTGKRVYQQTVKVLVQPDETLPAETRSELDRLQAQSPIGDFQRRTLELLGALDESTPRITAEQVDEILQSNATPEEMIAKINEIHGYPDYIWRGDPGSCAYWLDEKGSDKIIIDGEAMFFRSKVYDDGTGKEIKSLYPPQIDFGTITGPLDTTDRSYIIYNQIPYDDINPVKGDANHDGVFNMADIVTLQKWLMNVPETKMINWEMVDFNQDRKLNAIDLTLMKRELLCKQITS